MKPERTLELFNTIMKKHPDWTREDGDLPDDLKPFILEFSATIRAEQKEKDAKICDEFNEGLSRETQWCAQAIRESE